jgi:hypothetical protein
MDAISSLMAAAIRSAVFLEDHHIEIALAGLGTFFLREPLTDRFPSEFTLPCSLTPAPT